MNILTLNAGSSTVKAALYQLDGQVARGEEPRGLVWQGEGDEHDSLEALLAPLWNDAGNELHDRADIHAIAHRVVHGGTQLRETTRLAESTRDQIRAASELAPSHNAAALGLIDAVTALFGNAVPQVAVFDTAFHATLPERSYAYAGPFEWIAQGLRRFGFHGISHQYASERAARMMGCANESLRVVTCHLGSGCSLAAVERGRSVDTTMGYTPLDGLPMATRSGAIDPGILIHLLRHRNYTVDALDALLNNASGLAGLSGTSGDMREVLERADAGDARAVLALGVFVQRAQQGIAAMAATMGGLDAIVFTGGIGEHAPVVRQRIVEGLAFLGGNIDVTKNAAAGRLDVDLSASESRVRTLLIHAEENWMLARECMRVLKPRDAEGVEPSQTEHREQ